MRSKLFHTLFIFGGGLFLFTIGLSSEEIISFESRFYLFALEMLRHGISWFPTTYHMPYPDYPVTSTILIYLFAKGTGELNKFSAVFPSAMASALTLVVTYLIGELYHRRVGLFAAIFLLFTMTFVTEARTISLDQYITTITTFCFYFIYSANRLQKAPRFGWIFLFLILGFAIRGPLGLVIPSGVICVFYLLERDYKHFFTMGFVSFLLLIIGSSLLLAIAYKSGGIELLKKVIEMQVWSRMQQDMQTPPFYFYFVESIGAYAVSYPLAILVMLGMGQTRAADKKFLFQLTGWALIILVGLSFPADKKIRYILPAAPAFALICGFLLTVSDKKTYLYRLQQCFLKCCFLFPLVCLAALLWVHYRWVHLVYFFMPTIVILILLQGCLIVFRRHSFYVVLIAALTFIALTIFVIEPINLDLNHTKAFVLAVEQHRHKERANLVFFREGRDGLVIKYLVNMPEEHFPFFVEDENTLKQLLQPIIIIATEENFKKIQNRSKIKKILQGKIGRESVVVFRYQ